MDSKQLNKNLLRKVTRIMNENLNIRPWRLGLYQGHNPIQRDSKHAAGRWNAGLGNVSVTPASDWRTGKWRVH